MYQKNYDIFYASFINQIPRWKWKRLKFVFPFIYFCTTESFVRYYMENKKENPFKLVCARFFPLSKVMVYRPQVKS